MSLALALSALVGFAGTVLVLADLPWFGRRPLVERLRPYAPGAQARTSAGTFSVESFQEALRPLAQVVGRRLAHAFGVREDLARRLARVHSLTDPATYRVRQLGWSTAALCAAALCGALVAPPLPIALILVGGAPLLVFLVLEQQVTRASSLWQQRTRRELPVVAEQLGMLLGAGYSLPAALGRLAGRGTGVVATDLLGVCGRLQHGLANRDALAEWAERVDVADLHRFVSVLALERETPELHRLVASEARSMRQEANRRLVETIERRNQLVWIPVTVACLVPGVIFLAVPFVHALSLFSGS